MVPEKMAQENSTAGRRNLRRNSRLSSRRNSRLSSRLRYNLLLCIAVAGAGLAGCSEVRGVLGYEKTSPDEFAVITRAPLSLPPNYQLRPPQPGASRPQDAAAAGDARDLLLPGTRPATGTVSNIDTNTGTGTGTGAVSNIDTNTGTDTSTSTGTGAVTNIDTNTGTGTDTSTGTGTAKTTGETANAQRLLGLNQADPDIRQKVQSENTRDRAPEKTMLDKLLFWKETAPTGRVVDAPAEKKRLEENAALGKPVTEGETPTIEREEGALLEGLF